MNIKLWFLDKMIALCNLGLEKYSCAADAQDEINKVIETKNYFIQCKIKELDNKLK